MAVLLGIPFIVLFVTEATKRMIRKEGRNAGRNVFFGYC